MRYATWESRMSTPDTSGATARDSYRVLARKGRVDAIAMLEGPTFPVSLAYLWEWHQEIQSGLGEGLTGIAPLSWPTFDAWARRTGNDPEPHEAVALFRLDAVSRRPELLEAA